MKNKLDKPRLTIKKYGTRAFVGGGCGDLQSYAWGAGAGWTSWGAGAGQEIVCASYWMLTQCKVTWDKSECWRELVIQMCREDMPTKIHYRAKHYVTIFVRAAHWVSYFIFQQTKIYLSYWEHFNTNCNGNDCMILLICDPNCDAIGKFSVNERTRAYLEIRLVQRITWVRIRKLKTSFKPRYQWTRGNPPVRGTW